MSIIIIAAPRNRYLEDFNYRQHSEEDPFQEPEKDVGGLDDSENMGDPVNYTADEEEDEYDEYNDEEEDDEEEIFDAPSAPKINEQVPSVETVPEPVREQVPPEPVENKIPEPVEDKIPEPVDDINEFVKSLQGKEVSHENLRRVFYGTASNGRKLLDTIPDTQKGDAWENLQHMISSWEEMAPFENYFRSFTSKEYGKSQAKENDEKNVSQSVRQRHALDPFIKAVRGYDEAGLIPKYVSDDDTLDIFDRIRETYIYNKHEFGRSSGMPLGTTLVRTDFENMKDPNEALSGSPSRVERAMGHWNEISRKLSHEISGDLGLLKMFPQESQTLMTTDTDANFRTILPRGTNRDALGFNSIASTFKFITDQVDEEGGAGVFTNLSNKIGLSKDNVFKSPGFASPGKENKYPNGGEFYLTSQMVSPKAYGIGDKHINNRALNFGKNVGFGGGGDDGTEFQISTPDSEKNLGQGIERMNPNATTGIQQSEDKAKKSKIPSPPKQPNFMNFSKELSPQAQGTLSDLGVDTSTAFDRTGKYSMGLDVLSTMAKEKIWQGDTSDDDANVNEIKKKMAEEFVRSPSPMGTGQLVKDLMDNFNEFLTGYKHVKSGPGGTEKETILPEQTKLTKPIGEYSKNQRKRHIPSKNRQKLNLIAQDMIKDMHSIFNKNAREFASRLKNVQQGDKPALSSRLDRFKKINAVLTSSLLQANDYIDDTFSSGIKNYVAKLMMGGTSREQIEKAVHQKFPNEISSARKESFDSMLFDVDRKIDTYRKNT